MGVNIPVHLFNTLKNLRIEIFIGLVVFLIINWLRRAKNLPPGPCGLPVLGYLPFLGSEAYRTLHNLTNKYGPIFREFKALNRRFLLGVRTVNSPQSHIVRVCDAGLGKSGVFHSAEWHVGDWLSDGLID
ncbi:hypothetical protein TNCV_1898231 [Trichonephila clavipes]|uniref:Uncharacterized protein n=1 Tax=Trichonephila clavipes TaxID=2585209 RepID=A0A8X6WG42_TRICX|nr:hypothetical protein TNCV_1898231 [Trichonephila clavipes]